MKKNHLFLIIFIVILVLVLFLGYLYINQKNHSAKQPLSQINSCFGDSDCVFEKDSLCYKNQCVKKSPEIICDKAGQFWCKEKNICVDSFSGYCNLCMGIENKRCSCMADFVSNKTEGSECITSSGQVGECKEGSCTEIIGKPVSDNRILPTGKLNIGIIEFQLSDTKFGYFKDCNGYLQDDAQPCEGERKYDYLDLINNINKITKITDNKGDFYVNSLYSIEDWYKYQAMSYGINLDINVDIKGPYVIDNEPPKINMTDYTEFYDFFENSASSNGVNMGDYNITVFVYLNDLRNGQRFQSTYHRPNIAYIDTITSINAAYSEDLIVTALHEMGHGFGAGDDYVRYSCTDAGKSNEPHMACLMCGICEGSDCGQDLQISHPLITQSKVCDLTAMQFGWK